MLQQVLQNVYSFCYYKLELLWMLFYQKLCGKVLIRKTGALSDKQPKLFYADPTNIIILGACFMRGRVPPVYFRFYFTTESTFLRANFFYIAKVYLIKRSGASTFRSFWKEWRQSTLWEHVEWHDLPLWRASPSSTSRIKWIVYF